MKNGGQSVCGKVKTARDRRLGSFIAFRQATLALEQNPVALRIVAFELRSPKNRRLACMHVSMVCGLGRCFSLGEERKCISICS